MSGYRRLLRGYRFKRFNLGPGYFGLGISYSHGSYEISIGRWVWDLYKP